MDALPPPPVAVSPAVGGRVDSNAQMLGLPAFTHGQIVRVLWGVLLCILLAALDQTVVVPAVPAIAADLHGFGHLAWIVTAYLLTATSATPIYGKLSDIFGRRALLLPAIALFVLASALCAMAQSLTQLIAFRALQGLGGAGLMAMSQAVIADVVAPRERGRYQGYMAGAWGVASVAGPLLGGWMTDYLSWRAIFWINLPIGAVAFLLSMRALTLLAHHRGSARIDYVGAALLTACITTTLLIMTWGGAVYPWISVPIFTLCLATAASLALLIRQERRAADPLLPPRLFTNAVFTRGVLVAMLATAGMFGVILLLPLFFQLLKGADSATSGLLIVPFLAANVVGAYGSGQLARRLGRVRSILLGGLALATVGFAMMLTLRLDTSEGWIMVFTSVAGLGIGVCMPTSLVVVQNAAERRDIGAATGALLFLRSMGGAFGTTLVGALLTSRFAARLADAGIAAPPDLGALRLPNSGAALADPAVQGATSDALMAAFQVCFASCAVMMVLALAACLTMRDLPLQSAPVK